MKRTLFSLLLLFPTLALSAQKQAVDYVNPFIGTTNFGTCNPGALVPNGLMSVTPFNVMGSDLNQWDKDKRWWSTPYSSDNIVMTGFSHVNLSGVGCPDLSSLLVMPTSGSLNVEYHDYASTYTDDIATPGYYSNRLTRYNIKTEVTATPRTSRLRFTYPKGRANVLLNLGEGLTNESGASLRRVSDCEVEGYKLFGNFCYNRPDAVYPIYFVVRINRRPADTGYWKKQRPMEAEAEWDSTAGKYKLYRNYHKELAGDDIGCFFSIDAEKGEQVEVSVGVSLVSIDGARRNLNEEQAEKSFETLRNEARETWQKELSRIEVEGGTEDERTVFYTALYHLLIHPNIIQDTDGAYPAMESAATSHIKQGNRYTIFSLWDTYRGAHPLLTLVWPEKQLDMVRSMVDMYKQWGWMPKWELYSRETNTMDGDPATIVLADTYLRGLRDFDVNAAYEACRKSAFSPSAGNFLRPDNDEYMQRGYLPVLSENSFAVSAALEYYLADYALAGWASALGHKADADSLLKRSRGWENYFDPETRMIRPRVGDGSFLSPFNPLAGQNFEANPGFHEGCAWNYTFFVPHDIVRLAERMGGKKAFVERLQSVFDENLFDPANEPDMAYPYLFSYFKGEEWRTQELTQAILAKHFRNAFDGLPGNEDTGAMSAWAAFSMMGFFPDAPANPSYTLTIPTFKRIVLHFNTNHYNKISLIIEKQGSGKHIKQMRLGGKPLKTFRISHKELVEAETLTFVTD